MRLDVDNTLAFLLDRGLLDVPAIVEGHLMVIDEGRRNNNLHVHHRGAQGYVLKQPGEDGKHTSRTLRCEAWFYGLCNRDPRGAEALALLPPLVSFDEEHELLVLGLLDGSWSTWSDHVKAHGLSERAGEALGRALGVIHRSMRWLTSDAAGADLHARAPWVLRLHKPGPEILVDLSPAHHETLRILQKDERVGAAIDALSRAWSVETLIHGDIKGDNLLIDASPRRGVALRIVDWELIQLGDPFWDIAGALHDSLVRWVYSMPEDGGLPSEARAARAAHPIEAEQPGLRAMWRGYCASSAVPPGDARDLLQRAVRGSAARLIQTVYEHGFGAPVLSNASVLMLQIAINILVSPSAAAAHLFGLSVE